MTGLPPCGPPAGEDARPLIPRMCIRWNWPARSGRSSRRVPYQRAAIGVARSQQRRLPLVKLLSRADLRCTATATTRGRRWLAGLIQGRTRHGSSYPPEHKRSLPGIYHAPDGAGRIAAADPHSPGARVVRSRAGCRPLKSCSGYKQWAATSKAGDTRREAPDGVSLRLGTRRISNPCLRQAGTVVRTPSSSLGSRRSVPRW